MTPRTFDSVYGVDFSGAAQAGRNIWIARCEPVDRDRLRLVELHCLEKLAGTAERDVALAHLVAMIRSSRDALWAIDAPFGMPIEILPNGCVWPEQLQIVSKWKGGAYDFGLWCLNRAKKLGGANHIRRATDVEAKTPFDCYHYRIIYQAFHGMRDVLRPLHRTPGTAIAPFDNGSRLTRATRVIVEACPSSTLKRLNLPHQNYKQPTGGALTAKRRRTRATILEGLSPLVEIGATLRARIMRNPGGDALDAVIAAVGAAQLWETVNHRAIARHPRFPREGYLYA
jgi:hypothetical protein